MLTKVFAKVLTPVHTQVPIYTQSMYEICGIVYHLGSTPLSGHYRAALRYKGQWLLYDDGKVPAQIPELTDTILRNATLFWCIIPSAHTARTMNDGVELVGSRSSTAVGLGDHP